MCGGAPREGRAHTDISDYGRTICLGTAKEETRQNQPVAKQGREYFRELNWQSAYKCRGGSNCGGGAHTTHQLRSLGLATLLVDGGVFPSMSRELTAEQHCDQLRKSQRRDRERWVRHHSGEPYPNNCVSLKGTRFSEAIVQVGHPWQRSQDDDDEDNEDGRGTSSEEMA